MNSKDLQSLYKLADKIAQVNINSQVEQHIHLSNDKPSLPSTIPPPKGFIGRKSELSILQKAKTLGKTAFVLHGAGGVGKTDLALEFIRLNKSDYQANIRIDMQGLSSNALVPKKAMLEVIRAFDPDIPANLSEPTIIKLYNSLLNRHKPILFFDNSKDRLQIEPLNNASAFIVVTSRTSFSVAGGFGKEVKQMLPKDARDLLYSVTNDRERFNGLANILANLAGYLPMALLPLAALLAEDVTLEAQDLVEKYSDRKKALQLADPNRENLSVEASFDLSYELLSDELKERWRMLAVFPADFNLDAMQTIWKIDNGKEPRSELVKKHLLEFNQITKRSRFHDLARVYTLTKLTAHELFEAKRLHSIHFGKLLRSLDTVPPFKLAIFDLERINIEHGFSWLSDKIELDNTFAQICDDYVGYSGANRILSFRLTYQDYIKWLETGFKAARKTSDRQSQGNSLGNLGRAYYDLGEYRKAIEYYEDALKISKEIDDKRNEGVWLSNLGVTYDSLGKYQKAIEYHQEALKISKEIGDLLGEGNRLGNLGLAYNNLGEYQKAIEYFKIALAIAKEINDQRNEGIWFGGLGLAYYGLCEYQKAIKYYEIGLKISKKIGDKRNESNLLDNLGVAYNTLAEYKKAIEYHHDALKIAEQINDQQGKGIALGNLGLAHNNLEERGKARDYYLKSIAILKTIESPKAKIFMRYLADLENKS